MKQNKLNGNLRLLLDFHGMTESQLAKELKIANTTFHRIVNNVSSPNVSSLRPIAQYFNITIDQLIGDTPLFISAGDKIEMIKNKSALVPLLKLNFTDLEHIDKLINSIDSSNWHNWLFSTIDRTKDCFAVEVSDDAYKMPLLQNSVQIIHYTNQCKTGDICLILNKKRKFVGFKKLLIEGEGNYLANMYSFDKSIAEQAKENIIIGKVIQSIVNHRSE